MRFDTIQNLQLVPIPGEPNEPPPRIANQNAGGELSGLLHRSAVGAPLDAISEEDEGNVTQAIPHTNANNKKDGETGEIGANTSYQETVQGETISPNDIVYTVNPFPRGGINSYSSTIQLGPN